MLRHRHLTLQKRKPQSISVDGPSQTRLDRVVVVTPKAKVYLRGDDEIGPKTDVNDLGFPIGQGEPFTGSEYSSSQALYLVSDDDDVEVDVLVVGNG